MVTGSGRFYLSLASLNRGALILLTSARSAYRTIWKPSLMIMEERDVIYLVALLSIAVGDLNTMS